MDKITDDMIVRHYGVYDTKEGTWVFGSDANLYAVTCPRVAQAQIELYKKLMGEDFDQNDFEVREIIPQDPNIGLRNE